MAARYLRAVSITEEEDKLTKLLQAHGIAVVDIYRWGLRAYKRKIDRQKNG